MLVEERRFSTIGDRGPTEPPLPTPFTRWAHMEGKGVGSGTGVGCELRCCCVVGVAVRLKSELFSESWMTPGFSLGAMVT